LAALGRQVGRWALRGEQTVGIAVLRAWPPRSPRRLNKAMVAPHAAKGVSNEGGTAPYRNRIYRSGHWLPSPTGDNPRPRRCAVSRISRTSKNFCKTLATRAASSTEITPAATLAATAAKAGAISSGPRKHCCLRLRSRGTIRTTSGRPFPSATPPNRAPQTHYRSLNSIELAMF
jgi:hypothetical protein